MFRSALSRSVENIVRALARCLRTTTERHATRAGTDMQLRNTLLVMAIASVLTGVPVAHAQQQAQAVAIGDTQQRLDALEARLSAQQDEITRLRSQVDGLQMAMRGRGLQGAQDPQVAQQGNPAPSAGSSAGTAGAAGQDATPVQAIGQQQQSDDAERRDREKALVV